MTCRRCARKAQAGLDVRFRRPTRWTSRQGVVRLSDAAEAGRLGDGANQIEFVQRAEDDGEAETAKRLAEQARANLEAALEMTTSIGNDGG